MTDSSQSERPVGRCTYCGDKVPESELVWTGDDEGFACASCSEDDWFEATDRCKHGGPGAELTA